MTETNNMNGQVTEEMHQVLGEVHGSYDRQLVEDVAATYLNCVDKEGFVFDFGDAWQWAGYVTKASAKRVLLRELRENIDYEITRNSDSTVRKNQNTGDVKLPKGGDRKSEKIMLTARGMNQFCLAARTARGVVLRDCVMFLMRGVKRLGDAIRSGKVTISVVEQPPPASVFRIKGVEQTSAIWQELRCESKITTGCLGELLMKVGGTDLFSKVHSKINFVSTGTSSAQVQREVPGVRKGETVRNIAPSEALSAVRDIQANLAIWLQRLDDEDALPTAGQVEEKLAQICADRQQVLNNTGDLLKHPGAVIHKNGAINPVACRRVLGAITNGEAKEVHELAMTESSKRRRVNETEKKKVAGLERFGFVRAQA